jgi:serine/threonine-protein kinase ATR
MQELRALRYVESLFLDDMANLSQISAVLLSVLPRDELREVAVSCWSAMLTNFEEDDIEALLETTFFIVSHYWSSMDASTTPITTDMLKFLLEKRQAIIRKHITKLPSLPQSDQLEKYNQSLTGMRPELAIEAALRIFAERIGHENSGVVHQALNELVPYLKHNQRALHVSAVSQRPDTVIATLLRALLDCASRHNGVQFDIPQLCAQSMGLIGCLDFNQIEVVREQRYLVVADNFESAGEVSDFILFLLEEVLVPSFLSATDPRLQGFLCFVMQELLDRSGIKDAWSAQNVGQVDGAEIYRKWLALPEQTREVVTPFFTSKYVVAPMAPVPVEYPIFRPGKPFGGWLRSFAIDLLRKGQNPHADLIFEPLTRVIRVKDLSTAEFLLPYLVLHILLGSRSSDEEKEEVVNELIAILREQPPKDASYIEKEDMKRYCHVSG